MGVLADVWGVSVSTLQRYFSVWVPEWGRVSRYFCRLPLDLAYVEASAPDGFSERYDIPISTEVDGKDFPTHEFRTSNTLKRLARSNKIKHPAARVITHSMPGTGLVTLVSDLFFGRVAE